MGMRNRLGIDLILVGAALLAGTSCHMSSSDDPNRPLTARVRANDASAARQLAAGFYGVEDHAWRWTAGKFAVTLPVDDKARSNGATLNPKLTFPAAEMAQLGSTTLSADVNGTALPPETFSKAGDFTYSQDVPAAALTGSTLQVNFALSKSEPPSGQDQRELGAVVHEINLKTK
jgi:hypothetical protein